MGNKVPTFCHSWGIFLQFFINTLSLKIFPEIFVELNLGLCNTLERSIFSIRHIIHLTVIA